MKILMSLMLVMLLAQGTAYWTGKVEYITTVTGQRGVNCEYSYLGQKFWKTFLGGSCPTSITVR